MRAVDLASDAQHVRVTRITTPYSYLVPVTSFGTVQEVWDLSGRALVTLASNPLREGTPHGGAFGAGTGAAVSSDTAKRSVQWNPIAPGLVYLQNIVRPGTNDGRGTTGVRYVSWRAPFGASDTATFDTGGTTFTGLTYSRDGRTLFLNDSGAVIVVRTDDVTKRFRRVCRRA